MRSRELVRIWLSESDPVARAFANRIADATRAYSQVILTDGNAVDVRENEIDPVHGRYAGIPVVVLTPSFVGNKHNRRKLVALSRYLGSGVTAFCICCGMTVDQLRKQYADLGPLFDTVMIGEEFHLERLLEELQYYMSNREQILRENHRNPLLTSISMAITSLGYFFHLAHLAGFPAVFVLTYLLFSDLLLPRPWEIGLAALSLYSAGLSLNMLPAFDVWPWFGHRWRLPRLADDHDFSTQYGPQTAEIWASMLCQDKAGRAEGHALCTRDELRRVISTLLGFIRRTAFRRVFVLFVLVIPAIATLSYGGVAYTASFALLALTAGTLSPIAYYWATRRLQRDTLLTIGLTERELSRGNRLFGIQCEPSADEEMRENHPVLPTPIGWQVAHIISHQLLRSSSVRRLWRQHPDHVFISYAWADEEELSTAGNLAQVLDSMDCRFFYDERSIRLLFSPWRYAVALGLLECTHIFVIIGHRAREGRIMARELIATFHRWQTELLPAMICVVEPGALEDLLADASLPLAFKVALRWCPKLSFSECENPEIVRRVIRQRRRQGLWRDWLSLYDPPGAISRMLKQEER